MSQPADYNNLKNRVRHLERREQLLTNLFRDLLAALNKFAENQHHDRLKNNLDEIDYQMPPAGDDEV